MKIRDYYIKRFVPTYGDCFCDYEEGDILEVADTIAQNHVDTEEEELKSYLKLNIESAINSIESAINSEDFEFYEFIQQLQYVNIHKTLLKHLNDCLLNYVINYIEYGLNNPEITKQQVAKIMYINYSEEFDKLEDVRAFAKSICFDDCDYAKTSTCSYCGKKASISDGFCAKDGNFYCCEGCLERAGYYIEKEQVSIEKAIANE